MATTAKTVKDLNQTPKYRAFGTGTGAASAAGRGPICGSSRCAASASVSWRSGAKSPASSRAAGRTANVWLSGYVLTVEKDQRHDRSDRRHAHADSERRARAPSSAWTSRRRGSRPRSRGSSSRKATSRASSSWPATEASPRGDPPPARSTGRGRDRHLRALARQPSRPPRRTSAATTCRRSWAGWARAF